MALPKKILWQKFNRTSHNRNLPSNMAPANSMLWENVSFSSKRETDPHFSVEEEVIVEVFVKDRKIEIEFVNRLPGMEKCSLIRFNTVEATFPLAPDCHILRCEGGQQLKFKFGTRSAKETFEQAITIDSSDSGLSDEGSAN